MRRKKQVLVFMFDGFCDWALSYVLRQINSSDELVIRTISLDKGIKKSTSGFSIIPDLDFIPEVDLKDIDATNTAMLILPGGKPWDEKMKLKIMILVSHCLEEGIPVAALAESREVIEQANLIDHVLCLPVAGSHVNVSTVLLNALNLDHNLAMPSVYVDAMFE